MNSLPSNCPICGSIDLHIAHFECQSCNTSIKGQFQAIAQTQPFAQLSPEQIEFVRMFIKCEGKLNRMEGELGVSYPTVRNRLGEVVKAMGFEPSKEEPAAPRVIGEDERRRILNELDSGKLDATSAMKLLRGEVLDG